MRLKTGDKVIVIAGSNKGKEGTIKKVLKNEDRVIVEGVNIVHKHQKANSRESGGILDIEAPDGASEKNYNFNDKRYVNIPNVVGLEKNDAAKQLKQFKVEYSGTGSKVIYQSPSFNSRIYEGETIRLLLGE